MSKYLKENKNETSLKVIDKFALNEVTKKCQYVYPMGYIGLHEQLVITLFVKNCSFKNWFIQFPHVIY